MNRRRIIWIGLAVVVVAVAIVMLVVRQTQAPVPQQNNGTPTTEQASFQKACDIFTERAAKKLLGSDSHKVETATSNNEFVSTKQVEVSVCQYENVAVDPAIRAMVILRTAKDDEGLAANRVGYGGTKNIGVDDNGVVAESMLPIPEAYFNVTSGQAHILIQDGKYWSTVSVAQGDKAAKDTIFQIAQLVFALAGK